MPRSKPQSQSQAHKKNHSNKYEPQLRIIAGQWRGRKLSFPAQQAEKDLRPTGNRIRETLFNWLAPSLRDAQCLDMFAGSGSLAWEALSRGAAHCTIIDNDSATQKNLNAQQQQLKAENISQIVLADALKWLDRPATQTFDVVFLDPPFKNQELPMQCLELLISRQWLAKSALIYVEQALDSTFAEHPRLENYRHKQAGQVQYGLFTYLN